MKLLLDENLSRRIIHFLQANFPGSSQVALLGLEGANDAEIWQYAKEHGFVIVSRDSDFQERSLVAGHPPQVTCSKSPTAPKRLYSTSCWNITQKSNKHWFSKTLPALKSAPVIGNVAFTRNEIRKRLAAFAKEWQGARNERSQAQTFWLRFYECFGNRLQWVDSDGWLTTAMLRAV